MPDSPVGGCIREISYPINLLSAALDLHEILRAILFHIEINPGIPVYILRLYKVIILSFKPFQNHLIRHLTVHVYPAKLWILHRYEIVFRLAVWICRLLKADRVPRYQQTAKPPCVLYVHGLCNSVYLHMGCEPVWPFYELA